MTGDEAVTAGEARGSGPGNGLAAGLRLCDAAVIAFALWTLLCNVVVALHGSYRDLRWAAGAVAATILLLLAAAVARRGSWRRLAPGARDPERLLRALTVDPDLAVECDARPPPPWMLLAGTAGLSLLVLMAVRKGITPSWWVGSCLWFLFALIANGRPSPPRRLRPVDGPWTVVAFSALTLLGVAVTLVAHRPGVDDAFHVNLSVAALDDPDRPLLRTDTLHGLPGVEIRLPLHRLTAIEPLVALLSDLSGVAPIAVAHLVVPPLAALLLPLAYAHLFRLIVPRRWLLCVVFVMLLFVMDGSTHWWYGNFAFVRLAHPKAVMVSVLLPLVISYAVRSAVVPRPGHWVLLAAALIAGVGLSSTALFVIPLVAGLAFVSVARARSLSRATVLGLCTVLLYLVLVTVWLYPEASRAVRAIDHTDWRRARGLPNEALFGVLGTGPHLAACLVVALGGWLWIPIGIVRHLAAVFGAAVFSVLLAPGLAGYWAYFVTGPATHWRLLWVLPLPALIAVLCVAPLERRDGPPRVPQVVAALVLALIFLLVVPSQTALSRNNNTRLSWPGLKVPPAFEVAKRMVALAPPPSCVLGPQEVTTWVVTQRRHPFPLVVRGAYLWAITREIGQEESDRRAELVRWTETGRTSRGAGEIEAALRRYALAAVCVRESAIIDPSVLVRAGFEFRERTRGYELWVPRR